MFGVQSLALPWQPVRGADFPRHPSMCIGMQQYCLGNRVIMQGLRHAGSNL